MEHSAWQGPPGLAQAPFSSRGLVHSAQKHGLPLPFTLAQQLMASKAWHAEVLATLMLAILFLFKGQF